MLDMHPLPFYTFQHLYINYSSSYTRSCSWFITNMMFEFTIEFYTKKDVVIDCIPKVLTNRSFDYVRWQFISLSTSWKCTFSRKSNKCERIRLSIKRKCLKFNLIELNKQNDKLNPISESVLCLKYFQMLLHGEVHSRKRRQVAGAEYKFSLIWL